MPNKADKPAKALTELNKTKLKSEENGENERCCHKQNRQINTILILQNLTSEDFKENTSNCRLSKKKTTTMKVRQNTKVNL